MARRRRAEKRRIKADPNYGDVDLARFINRIMRHGKRTTAQRIVYKALQQIEEQARQTGMDVFRQALRNAAPAVEVRSRRVGGATYQVPREIRTERQLSLSIKWLVIAAQARTGRPMAERLAQELIEASRGQGAAVKRKEDLHRMADANRAFAHYRW
jgi:small subunit ribosomal protein S7